MKSAAVLKVGKNFKSMWFQNTKNNYHLFLELKSYLLDRVIVESWILQVHTLQRGRSGLHH